MEIKKKLPRSVKNFLSYSVAAKIVLIFCFLLFCFEAVLHLYPLFWVINNSLKTTEEFVESATALTTT